jgi:hypothetical protein
MYLVAVTSSRAEAVKIAFSPLDGLDKFSLVQAKRIDAESLRHFPQLVQGHFLSFFIPVILVPFFDNN